MGLAACAGDLEPNDGPPPSRSDGSPGTPLDDATRLDAHLDGGVTEEQKQKHISDF